jgi:hypothetical protein
VFTEGVVTAGVVTEGVVTDGSALADGAAAEIPAPVLFWAFALTVPGTCAAAPAAVLAAPFTVAEGTVAVVEGIVVDGMVADGTVAAPLVFGSALALIPVCGVRTEGAGSRTIGLAVDPTLGTEFTAGARTAGAVARAFELRPAAPLAAAPA